MSPRILPWLYFGLLFVPIGLALTERPKPAPLLNRDSGAPTVHKAAVPRPMPVPAASRPAKEPSAEGSPPR